MATTAPFDSIMTAVFSSIAIILLLSAKPIQARDLPNSLLIGYVSDCDDTNAALQAVQDGVNVLIWSFWGISSKSKTVNAGFNMTCVDHLRLDLEEMGFDDVVFLASTGGWDGGHLNDVMSAHEIYDAWKQWGGHVFDGFDFDLEGNDNMTSTMNIFTVRCLETMGEMSRLAKLGKSTYVYTGSFRWTYILLWLQRVCTIQSL